ncbi:MAG TPA: FCD domain-containing protein [Candidatus Lumbricidophila sp.]|nr:FCD domain-containing protein [Candidatus Lumbricidophila sp.]
MTIVKGDSRAWQQVLAHVETQLLGGDVRPGDRLPSERALAEQLGVSRSSVREAIRVLEAFGLVRTATGSGPNAGAIVIATPGTAMSTLMRLQVSATGFPVADIVRTRLVIEAGVVGDLCTSHGTSDQLTEANALLDAMDSDTLSAAEFLALDAAFHLALAEASGNTVIAAMLAGLRAGIEAYASEGASRIADWPRTRDRLRAEHRGILTAVHARDAAAAHSRIHDHISGYYAEIVPPTRNEGPN